MGPAGPAPHAGAGGDDRPRGETNDFAAFRGLHEGAAMLVCGCGESLTLLDPATATAAGALTVGVNDVERHFTPTYLVVVNPRRQFAADRFRHITASRARVLFTQIADLGVAHPRIVRFPLGTYGGTDVDRGGVLHYTQNSPYVAICLAVHMGARRIGVLGVDFTERHFFGGHRAHPLAARLDRIDREYAALAAACAARGIEVVNVSPISRLRSLPRLPLPQFLEAARGPASLAPAAPIDANARAHASAGASRPSTSRASRVFVVNYRFLACGDVFTDGLRHAAAELGIEAADASWDDPALPEKVARFGPDLLLVVHGRKFVQRWGAAFRKHRSAVWLLDEPYEVDDSSTYARTFDHVFVNDPATIGRHSGARYVPVCYDPRIHAADTTGTAGTAPRRYRVGFVGGANTRRERMLDALAQHDLLSYVVGGPWRSARLKALSLGDNVSHARTAELYRATTVIVNVFRETHHYNRARVAATSMNPRIYEALACGAVVVSEARPEIAERIPEMPTFDTEAGLVAAVRRLLADPPYAAQVREACAARLRGDTYARRLRAMLEWCMRRETSAAIDAACSDQSQPMAPAAAPASALASASTPHVRSVTSESVASAEAAESAESAVIETPDAWTRNSEAWMLCDPVECVEEGDVTILRKPWDASAGSERGLVTRHAHATIDLSFEACIAPGACFVAKVHQADSHDQTTNSYHLYCDDRASYLARHNHVFRAVAIGRGSWESLRLTCANGVLSFYRSGRLVHAVRDRLLPEGFAFLGVKAGEVRLRRVRLGPLDNEGRIRAGHEYEVLHDPEPIAPAPRVSIVTTVYDRTACLRQCLRSVTRLHFDDYEHIIVCDAPPPDVLAEIQRIVAAEDRERGGGRVRLFTLARRFNNWGIAPASVGLQLARGEYVCFLSDDNGYAPHHVGTLVSTLDANPHLGFAYSSCLYDGRLVLRHPVPRPARIDLGQPMFRRELFELYLNDTLPFNMMAWDWALIDTFVRRGVRWRHVDTPSFIFRLAKYPQHMSEAS